MAIDSVSFGEVVIDGKTYYSDVIVWWDGKVDYVPKDRLISVDDMRRLLEREPTDIVIGTGIEGMIRISEDAVYLAETRKVDLFIEVSHKALQIFNGLVKDGKKAVAVIHTTG